MTTANIISAIASGPPAAPAGTAASSTSAAATGSQDEQPFGALIAAAQANEGQAGDKQAGSTEGGKTAPVTADPSARPVLLPVAMQLATKLLPGQDVAPSSLPVALPTVTEAGAPTDGKDGFPTEGKDAAPEQPAAPDPAGPIAEAPKPVPTPALPGAEIVAAPVVAVATPAPKPVVKSHGEKDAARSDAPKDVPVQSATQAPALAPTAPPAAEPVAPPPGLMAMHLAPATPMPSTEPTAGPARASDSHGDETLGSVPLAAATGTDSTPAPHGGAREASLPTADAVTAKASDQATVPSTTFAQSLPAMPVRATAQIYGGTAPGASVDQPVVSAQAGQIGHDMGVAIARGVDAGRDALLVRLDPAEMGRVHVRLSFEHDGAVRVAMTAESSTALDMLRREAGDLGRALSDAGVRSDSQSFRFDSGGSDARQFAQQRGSGNGGTAQQQGRALSDDMSPENPAPQHALRSAGGLNLII